MADICEMQGCTRAFTHTLSLRVKGERRVIRLIRLCDRHWPMVESLFDEPEPY